MLRLIQRITKWAIFIVAIIIGLSGLLYYEWYAVIFGDIFLFSWHLDYDLLLSLLFIIHSGIGLYFYLMRKKIRHWSSNLLIGSLIISLTLTTFYLNIPPDFAQPSVKIGSFKYPFDPLEIDTVRPDFFQNDSFSVFDTLVYLDKVGEISLTYHFSASMNTYVIDSLKSKGERDDGNWWYHVFYDGGHIEPNAVRIDHYPWKPGTTITMYHENVSYINDVYSIFEEEVSRLANNNGNVIIPTVIINGSSFHEEFHNVLVTPHNLRNETLQFGVITALDVIMSLGDLGKITYELQWYESLRSARYIHNYFVDKINSDATRGRCGFVYEAGDLSFKYPGPNYIYLASDVRILISPQYVSFFWDCL